jgi:hypothetical protein
LNKKLLLKKGNITNDNTNPFDFIEDETIEPFDNFISHYPNLKTRESTLERLIYFLNFVNIDKANENIDQRYNKFFNMCKKDPKYCKNQLNKYFTHLHNRIENKEISKGYAHNCKYVVKKIVELLGNITIDWKRVNKTLGDPINYAKDIGYSVDDINKMCEYPDPRIRMYTYVSATAGLRQGGWAFLKNNGKWGVLRKKHVRPYKDENGNVLCAYLKVYDGEGKDEYWTLITKESYDEIIKWLDFRQKNGETITEESPLLRKLWDLQDPNGAKIDKNTEDNILLTDEGISSLMRRVVKFTGLRPIFKENPNSSRHKVKLTHGFRKFHFSGLKGVRNPDIRQDDINILTGHRGIGYNDNYLRDSNDPENRISKNLVKDYLRAEPFLTIDPSKRNLDYMEKAIEKRLESKYEQQNKELRKEIVLMKFSDVIDDMIEKNSQPVITTEQQLQYFIENKPPRITESDIELIKEMIKDREITDYVEESEQEIEFDDEVKNRFNHYGVFPTGSYIAHFDKLTGNLIVEFEDKSKPPLNLPPLENSPKAYPTGKMVVGKIKKNVKRLAAKIEKESLERTKNYD